MLSYKTQKQERIDKSRVEALRVALGAARACLRQDDCGLWILKGSRGYAATFGDDEGDGYHLIAGASEDGNRIYSRRKWTATKQRLQGFCRVTQDGDEEGCFHMPRLPTPEQAEDVRYVLGLHSAPNLTPAQIEAFKRRMAQSHAAGMDVPKTST